ncbi:TetR family transcriptional regulator, partial [Stenotrophomonas sp. MB339]|uniref:TetR family transcriptional regulator n=1 Tax=Stenotrophomonas sp. MB339 TaxID=1663558 RepID=UPI0011156126
MQTPAVARARSKPAETRQDELMDAAQALFLSQGGAATTISDIVAAAAAAEGTSHTYFAPRHDILPARAQRRNRQLTARVYLPVHPPPPGGGAAAARSRPAPS